MHLCHPWDICNNFYKWHFVIRLQEMELVFGRTHGRTDRLLCWNSILVWRQFFKETLYISIFVYSRAESCNFEYFLVHGWIFGLVRAKLRYSPLQWNSTFAGFVKSAITLVISRVKKRSIFHLKVLNVSIDLQYQIF